MYINCDKFNRGKYFQRAILNKIVFACTLENRGLNA